MRTQEKTALLAVFSYGDDLLRALKALENLRTACTVYSPSGAAELRDILKKGPSPVRYYTLFGGLFGLVSGFSLAVYTVLQWKFVVGGKPVIPWIPFVIIGFEFLILCGFLISFAGLLIHAGLPRFKLPVHYDPRFSDDRFGLLVYYGEMERDAIRALLKNAGAEEIRHVQG
jgi:hypothetical protein